jgi:hypothetical protein
MALILCSLLGGVLPLNSSLAHVLNTNTSLTIRRIPGGDVEKGTRVLIFGKLKSSQAGCRSGESVKLQRKGRLLRTDRTDAEGEYRFKLPIRKDSRLSVVFDGSIETSYGHSHGCNASRSRSLLIDVQAPPRVGGGGGGARCDPSYPTVCIPPPPPDRDCADVNATNFTVKPPDPHGFDGDNDGIGCET